MSRGRRTFQLGLSRSWTNKPCRREDGKTEHGREIELKKLFRNTLGIVAAAILLTTSGCDGLTALPADFAGSAGTASVGAQADPRSGETVDCYFPRAGQDAQAELIRVIRSADSTLDMAIYSFTDTDVADAVVACSRRGVAVRVISDKTQSGNEYQKKVLARLKKEKIPVKVDSHSGIMHLKVTIADGKTATTGSYNYTKSADEENDEVFVVLHDEEIAQDFEREFESMWNDGKRFEDYR
jgi:phosphatidylserine/phosphatidylglycerophosphate/cardiolipin synthase-like enzyme